MSTFTCDTALLQSVHFNDNDDDDNDGDDDYRVTTCLENLEMSGILLKIRELSWKKSRHSKVA